MFADTESDNMPVGDRVAEGGSDGRKDAGEEGGATKGSTIDGGWDGCSAEVASALVGVVSGTRTACPIRLFLFNPKHQ